MQVTERLRARMAAAGVELPPELIDVEPDPAQLRFGMPVEMTTGVSQQDREGNDVVAFYFRPARG